MEHASDTNLKKSLVTRHDFRWRPPTREILRRTHSLEHNRTVYQSLCLSFCKLLTKKINKERNIFDFQKRVVHKIKKTNYNFSRAERNCVHILYSPGLDWWKQCNNARDKFSHKKNIFQTKLKTFLLFKNVRVCLIHKTPPTTILNVT